jgi:M6 family metalloprotease-like protein
MPNAAIPDLRAPKGLNCGEAATDFKHYVNPKGTLRAVMLFVGFPDAPGVDDPARVGDALLGKGAFGRLYRDQSFSNLSIDVTTTAKLGWRPLAKKSSQYGTLVKGEVEFKTSAQHRQYIADAVAAFAPGEVPFADFAMVFVVAPKEAAFRNSPAFPVTKGNGVKVGKTEIRAAVTLGRDSYTNSFINLVHEVGHLFGLPDLYPSGKGAEESAAGCWAIMSDIFRASGFLGWHRHKNGWLDASRKTYVRASGTTPFTLAPLSAQSGLSMLVLPVDDAAKPSKVFVVEVAQPTHGLDGKAGREGVLLYTVDARRESGDSPVEVVPNVAGHDPTFGNLFQAPFAAKDDSGTRTAKGGNATIRLNVLRKNGAGFDVEVTYTSP